MRSAAIPDESGFGPLGKAATWGEVLLRLQRSGQGCRTTPDGRGKAYAESIAEIFDGWQKVHEPLLKGLKVDARVETQQVRATILAHREPVEVVRKDIKNLHLAVYPPSGHVRVAAPQRLSDEAVRLMVISRLRWIQKRQAHYEQQHRQSERDMVSGESHYFLGSRYRLDVVEDDGPASIRLRNSRIMELRVRPGADRERLEAILYRWYRERLREEIPSLLARWQPVIGVEVADLGIKRMRTRWGSCNIEARRIWLNVELVKKPPSCLEYILVHEMVHLLERHHNDRFRQYMDRFMPQWRVRREELNRAPLAHERWQY